MAVHMAAKRRGLMLTMLVLVLAAVAVALLAGVGVRRARFEPVGAEAVKGIAAKENRFAIELYGQVKNDPAVERNAGNLCFSPYSVYMSLAMTAGGARGRTAQQMQAALGFGEDMAAGHRACGTWQRELDEASGGGLRLHTANRLWGQKGYQFNEAFLAMAERDYGSPMGVVDFKGETERERARVKINRWVEDQTAGKVDELVGEGAFDEKTRLVLTNAIYFKADWRDKFEKYNTQPMDFNVTAEKTVKVPMMFQRSKYKYFETDGMQMLELPYKNERVSMMVLLPRAVDGAAKLERQLTADILDEMAGMLLENEVQVYLPRFMMRVGIDLRAALAAMGMGDAFDARSADFSGICEREPMVISAVGHEAYIKVDEQGTEAVAVTGTTKVAAAKVERVEPKVFKADHPFLFLVRDRETGGILFMGRVAEPKE